MARILHAGCGGDSLPPQLRDAYDEVRLDINPKVKPDIVASLVDMGDIGDFDGVYCAHCLEHLHWEDVERALGEFRRVLKPGGFAMAIVPDLEGVRPTEDVVYESPAGPITGLDMLFGYRGMTRDNVYMRHLSGFVRETLEREMTRAGFSRVSVRSVDFSLIGVGVRE